MIEVYYLIANLFKRLGLSAELLQIYRKIIQEDSREKQKLIVEFSHDLLINQSSDPHIILDFLHKELPEIFEKEDIRSKMFLGELYYKSKNKDKAYFYFYKVF